MLCVRTTLSPKSTVCDVRASREVTPSAVTFTIKTVGKQERVRREGIESDMMS